MADCSALVADTLLLVLARAGRRGQVKTRLIPELGEEGALQVHEALLARTLKQAAAFPGPARLLLDRPDRRTRARAQRLGLSVGYQCGNGLGERMCRAIATALVDHRRVLLVGSDCPVLDQAYLAKAATQLIRWDAVLGPSDDGGYVLLGGRAGPAWQADRLASVRMGTRHALADTRRALEAVARVGTLDPLWDVDWPEDVRRARHLGLL